MNSPSHQGWQEMHCCWVRRRFRPTLWRTAAIIWLPGAWACASEAGARDTLTSRDSAGIHLVHLGALDAPTAATWRMAPLYSTRAIESLRLGRYIDARLLPDSSLLLTAIAQLVELAPDGTLRRTIGRAGNGPGEYSRIIRVALAADGQILIGDYGAGPGAGRITILRPDATIRRILPGLGPVGALYEMDPLTLLSDGTILATYWQRRPNRDIPGVPHGDFVRDSAPLVAFDTLGREMYRLGLWPGLERVHLPLGWLVPRFARTAVFRSSGEWTLIGATDSLDLSLYEGERLRLRLTAPPAHRSPGAAADRRWRQAIAEDYADVADVYLTALAHAPEVRDLPTVGGVALDERGSLWVGELALPGDSTRAWRVFSPAGVPLGRLTLPAHEDPMVPGSTELLDVRGDRLALLRIEEAGEPVVEVYRIER